MTCETASLQGRGVSFALVEAEVIWLDILRDAIEGDLLPTYCEDRRWWGKRLRPASPGAAVTPRPAPLRRAHAGRLPGPGLPLHLQLLFGHQDRRDGIRERAETLRELAPDVASSMC
jgi:hypothetical protein